MNLSNFIINKDVDNQRLVASLTKEKFDNFEVFEKILLFLEKNFLGKVITKIDVDITLIEFQIQNKNISVIYDYGFGIEIVAKDEEAFDLLKEITIFLDKEIEKLHPVPGT